MSNQPKIRGTIAVAGIALLLCLSVPILASPVASAASPNPTAPPQQWAYAGEHWLNASLTSLHGEYTLSEHFGWTLIYTLTNTSNSTFTLEAQRTMGISYQAQFCAPSCSNPTASVNLSVVGEETETGFANFTTNATVNENGTAAPALGLENSQSSAQASLNESMTGTRTNLGISRSGGTHLAVSGSAHTHATFSPALGLIPWQLSPGLGWNSSAAYTASGGFALQYSWDVLGPNGTLNGSGSPSGQMNRSGTVGLLGMDLGNLTLANGLTTNVVVLAWAAGPFDAVDGIILLPHGFEIFGAGIHPWGADAPGAQSVLTSRIDIVRDLAHHRLRFAAAASAYAGSDTLAPAAAGSTSSAMVPAAGGSSGPALVQAQPVTVPQAQSVSACLMGHCSGGSSTSSSLRPLTEVLVAGLVVVAVVGSVGVIEYRAWARRRSSGGLVGGYSGQVSGSGGPTSPYVPAQGSVGPVSPPRKP